MTGEDLLPAGHPMLDWLETLHQRMVALLERQEAGEDVTNAEAVEMSLECFQKLRDVDPVFDSDRVKALLDRIEAGEQVDDAEFQATWLDAITNMDGVDPDHAKGLVDRIEAGEEVDDAEVEATSIDVITNMDGTAG